MFYTCYVRRILKIAYVQRTLEYLIWSSVQVNRAFIRTASVLNNISFLIRYKRAKSIFPSKGKRMQRASCEIRDFVLNLDQFLLF